MAQSGDTRIRLCGHLEMELDGREVEPSGRQGRVLLAFFILNRSREVGRDELLELLWPERAPADPSEALSVLLSRLRRALGEGVLIGRRGLRLSLPQAAYVDFEAAHERVATAEAALGRGDPVGALAAARACLGEVTELFLPGDDLPWVEERRRELEELRLRALEVAAAAGIALGGNELAAAERAARLLVDAAPFRESGHRLLMEALAARGDAAEALRAYDALRVMLREELGAAPGQAIMELHRQLLEGEAPSRVPPPREPARLEPPPAEERKLVTVLCAEPALPEDRADPEELRALLTQGAARLRATVERFGGSVHESEAGPALALFGAQAAHENDAERGVRAALEACSAGTAARAAVATGEALVSGARRAATGEVVAEAVRLLGAAPPGSVALDGETHTATREIIESAFSGELPIARAVRATGRRQAGAARFIGRRHELAVLEQLYGTVVDQASPRLVTLAGQAGIGKSRLAEELATRVSARGAAVLRGRCVSYLDGTSCWALREVLWEAAAIGLDDPAPEAARKLRFLAERLGLDEQMTAALAAQAGIALPGAEAAELPPEALTDEIAFAWPLLLGGLASRGPVLVLIEDLHWADTQLLGMLERLAVRAEGPVMLLSTARREFAEAHPGWGGQAGATQIVLEPLSPPDARELLEELLPTAPDRLRARVSDLAEGNPFFAEEIARHVAGGGDLAAIPHSVRSLLAARIDALPAAEKSVLQHAAVVGRRFWASALEPNETGTPLPPLLHSLEARGLVVARPVSSLPGERELVFSHGLKREVAYRSIPRGARGRVHAAVGAWLERLSGDRREEFIDLIAYHHEAAADPRHVGLAWPGDAEQRERVRAKAVEVLLEAGSAARRGMSAGDAVRYADRALALASGDRERLRVLELRARAHHAAVRSDEALAAYLEAIALAGALAEHEEAARLRAHAVLLCCRYSGGFSGDTWRPLARALVEEGLRETGEETESFATGALLIGRSWGNARWQDPAVRDMGEARRDIERAVAIAESVGSRFLLSHALEILTWAVFEDGFCEAEKMGRRLLRAAGPMSNLVEAHESVSVAAICFVRAGRFEQARAEAARATRMAARMSPHRALHAAASEAMALVPSGHLGELLEATSATLDRAEEEGERICATGLVGVAGRALVLYETGDERELGRALELLRGLGPTPGSLRTYGYPTAEMLRPVLGLEATRCWIDELLPAEGAAARVHRLRAWLPVLALAGEAAELEPALVEARVLAECACAPALGWIADWAEATVAAREGRTDEASELAEAAAAALDGFGERYTAALLLSEILPLLGPDRSKLTQLTVARLAQMGALSSSRRLLASSAPWPSSAAP